MVAFYHQRCVLIKTYYTHLLIFFGNWTATNEGKVIYESAKYIIALSWREREKRRGKKTNQKTENWTEKRKSNSVENYSCWHAHIPNAPIYTYIHMYSEYLATWIIWHCFHSKFVIILCQKRKRQKNERMEKKTNQPTVCSAW